MHFSICTIGILNIIYTNNNRYLPRDLWLAIKSSLKPEIVFNIFGESLEEEGGDKWNCETLICMSTTLSEVKLGLILI